jgi:fibro-slime domain-containing protein
MIRQQSATHAVLAVITLAGVALPTARAQTEGEGVILVGVVRDFMTSHPDFGITPELGPGHVAGNMKPYLGAMNVPELGSNGFRVATQYTNKFGDPIAPHMYWVGPGPAVPVTASPIVVDMSYADSFDPDVGLYGGANVGPAPHFVVGSDMPEITPPTGLPAPIPLYKCDTNKASTTLGANLVCDRLLVANHHTLYISGDVTIVCRDEFSLQNHGKIELMPGARLTIYTQNTVNINDQCAIGTTSADCARIKIFHSGAEPFLAQNQITLYATIVSPYAPLKVLDGSEFYGAFTGDTMHLSNQAAYHAVGELPAGCHFEIADISGTLGSVSGGDISSANSFQTWFRNFNAVNATAHYPITLYPDGTGFYEYKSDTFYPIDHELYGNEGQSHNHNFTYVVGADFTFNECQDQIIELQGTDDIWVYVDGRLLVDLGGVGADQVQIGEVDRLQLEDGEQYTLMVFFAHRSKSTPSFRIRTNLGITNNRWVSQVPIHTGFD